LDLKNIVENKNYNSDFYKSNVINNIFKRNDCNNSNEKFRPQSTDKISFLAKSSIGNSLANNEKIFNIKNTNKIKNNLNYNNTNLKNIPNTIDDKNNISITKVTEIIKEENKEFTQNHLKNLNENENLKAMKFIHNNINTANNQQLSKTREHCKNYRRKSEDNKSNKKDQTLNDEEIGKLNNFLFLIILK